MQTENSYSEIQLKNGGWPIAFSITNLKSIEECISKFNLQPVSEQHLYSESYYLPTETMEVNSKQQVKKRYLKNGGMKAPHIHFNGEIFLLNQEQWHDFSSKIIRNFQQKLGDVKGINYQQMIELSNAMESIV